MVQVNLLLVLFGELHGFVRGCLNRGFLWLSVTDLVEGVDGGGEEGVLA